MHGTGNQNVKWSKANFKGQRSHVSLHMWKLYIKHKHKTYIYIWEREKENMIVAVGLSEDTTGRQGGKENDREWIRLKCIASVYEVAMTKFTEGCWIVE
jgi:hypothetical protein